MAHWGIPFSKFCACCHRLPSYCPPRIGAISLRPVLSNHSGLSNKQGVQLYWCRFRVVPGTASIVLLRCLRLLASVAQNTSIGRRLLCLLPATCRWTAPTCPPLCTMPKHYICPCMLLSHERWKARTHALLQANARILSPRSMDWEHQQPPATHTPKCIAFRPP